MHPIFSMHGEPHPTLKTSSYTYTCISGMPLATTPGAWMGGRRRIDMSYWMAQALKLGPQTCIPSSLSLLCPDYFSPSWSDPFFRQAQKMQSGNETTYYPPTYPCYEYPIPCALCVTVRYGLNSQGIFQRLWTQNEYAIIMHLRGFWLSTTFMEDSDSKSPTFSPGVQGGAYHW